MFRKNKYSSPLALKGLLTSNAKMQVLWNKMEIQSTYQNQSMIFILSYGRNTPV